MIDFGNPKVLTVFIFCMIMIFTVLVDVILVFTLKRLNRRLDRYVEKKKARKEK